MNLSLASPVTTRKCATRVVSWRDHDAPELRDLVRIVQDSDKETCIPSQMLNGKNDGVANASKAALREAGYAGRFEFTGQR